MKTCPCCGQPATHIIIYGCVNLHMITIYVCEQRMRTQKGDAKYYQCMTCTKPLLGYMKNIKHPWINGYFGSMHLIPADERIVTL